MMHALRLVRTRRSLLAGAIWGTVVTVLMLYAAHLPLSRTAVCAITLAGALQGIVVASGAART
jgi:hypothetical protein